jgi:DNA transposition AAA+ family ATPase
MSNAVTTPTALPFMVTKEHRRFVEFCDACHRQRYIGLCYGPPGVGKTLSARHYLLAAPAQEGNLGSGSRTILYTPTVSNNPGQIARDVQRLRDGLRYRLGDAYAASDAQRTWPPPDRTELMLVDEADRLKMAGIEQMRDIYDRSQVGLVLIGMPGIEKRLARYPQLYSRVGFVHAFRPLGADETRHILAQQWPQLGLMNPDRDFTDAEAIAAIIRITGGNFRLLHRLCIEIQRILQINELQTVTKEVVETARETLVIGLGL